MVQDTKGKIVALVISQGIITAFMVTDLYVFITKESIIARTLAAVAFVIFLSFTFISLKSISRLKNSRA